MEVHHHPIAIGSHTSRKKWTHYFWEFLMLFLAVFCGFLAENQREHIIEHQRAKVYATNLYEELKKDTSRLNSVALRHKEIAGKLDTLCMLIKDKTKNATNGMLYYYGTAVTQVEFFSSSNTTIARWCSIICSR